MSFATGINFTVDFRDQFARGSGELVQERRKKQVSEALRTWELLKMLSKQKLTAKVLLWL